MRATPQLENQTAGIARRFFFVGGNYAGDTTDFTRLDLSAGGMFLAESESVAVFGSSPCPLYPRKQSLSYYWLEGPLMTQSGHGGLRLLGYP